MKINYILFILKLNSKREKMGILSFLGIYDERCRKKFYSKPVRAEIWYNFRKFFQERAFKYIF
jgi:hypothetical protein